MNFNVIVSLALMTAASIEMVKGLNAAGAERYAQAAFRVGFACWITIIATSIVK